MIYIILYASIFRLTILKIYMSSVLALQCSINLAMKTHNIESRPNWPSSSQPVKGMKYGQSPYPYSKFLKYLSYIHSSFTCNFSLNKLYD